MSIVSDLLFGVKIVIGIICLCAITFLQILIYTDARKNKNIITYGMLVGTILLEAYAILTVLESNGY